MEITKNDLFSDGVWSLGYFRPNTMDDLESDFREWVATHTDFLDRLTQNSINVQVRCPWDQWSALQFFTEIKEYGYPSSNWSNPGGYHQDMGGKDFFMLVWANTRPTEIKSITSNDVIVPRPYEVVGFNNSIYEHRQPVNMRMSTAAKRFFIRSWNNISSFK